jgi:hypothetical protein
MRAMNMLPATLHLVKPLRSRLLLATSGTQPYSGVSSMRCSTKISA